jgi:glycosyltransferase involved in cell wall biosynthesis
MEASMEDAAPRLAPVTFLVFDAFSGDGVARTTANLANALSLTRPVRLISLYRTEHRPRFDLAEGVELSVLCDRTRPWSRLMSRLVRRPSRLSPNPSPHTMSAHTDRLLERAIRAVPEGVVVSTRPSLHLALTTWAPPHLRTVGWDHLNYPARMGRPRVRAALRAAVPRLDAYVVLTDADAADYRQEFGDDGPLISVIRNALSWPVTEQLPPLDTQVVVSAGRLAPRKGWKRLVRAFASLVGEVPDWRLRIHGDGRQREELHELVRDLGVAAQVQLPGYCPDLPRALKAGSVFAMASRSEGFPMVLIEAMSCGLPPLAFDCPRGPGEIIRHEQNGLLVQEGRQDLFVAELRRLLTDADLRRRLGDEARRDAEQYTPDRIVGDWDALFARLETSAAG